MLSYSPVPEVPDPNPCLRIATDAAGVSALRRLVDLLAEIAHPCVVSVEQAQFDETHAEIAFTPVEGTSLNAIQQVEPLAKACAAVASAIAHVHQHDIALQEIHTDSFVVRKDLSVVLRHFDAATKGATPTQKQEDLRLFAEYAQSCVPEEDPIRDRINNIESSPLRESFARILDQAMTGELDARQLAEKLRHALWFDNTNSTAHAKKGRSLRIPLGRRAGIATITALIAIAIVVTTHLQSNAAPSPQSPSTPSCQLRIGTTVDVNGDGCPDAITLKDGTVTINAERYVVGEPTDEMAIGNWNCNGKITLALLRPSTGEIFVYDDWPSVGASLNPRVLTTGGPNNGLRVIADNGCDELGVGNQQFNAREAK